MGAFVTIAGVGPSVGLVVGLHETWGATVGWAVVGLQLICGITVGPDDGAALGAALGVVLGICEGRCEGRCEEGGNEILSVGGLVGLDVREELDGLHETCVVTGLVVGTGVSEKSGNITLLSVSNRIDHDIFSRREKRNESRGRRT